MLVYSIQMKNVKAEHEIIVTNCMPYNCLQKFYKY